MLTRGRTPAGGDRGDSGALAPSYELQKPPKEGRGLSAVTGISLRGRGRQVRGGSRLHWACPGQTPAGGVRLEGTTSRAEGRVSGGSPLPRRLSGSVSVGLRDLSLAAGSGDSG